MADLTRVLGLYDGRAGMDLHLNEKAVIVTGGGAGIGAAIVRVLAEEGAVPVVFDRAALAPAFEAELRALQPLTQVHRVELTDSAACRDAIATVARSGVAVHGLVNNAGVNDHVGLDGPESGREPFLRSLERNLTHAYVLVGLCLPMLRGTHGAIVNIASKTALTGQGATSGYVAAKGALLGLTREWAVALRDDGILYAGDAPTQPPYEGIKGVAITLNYDDVAQAEAAFAALVEGGRVTMPMQEAFWARRWGMLVDRFGTPWIVNGELLPL